MSTIELNARSFAGVSYARPNANDHTSSTFDVVNGGSETTQLLINWVLPTSGPEIYQIINGFKVKFWASNSKSSQTMHTGCLDKPFDATCITYGTGLRWTSNSYNMWISHPTVGYWESDFVSSLLLSSDISKNGLIIRGIAGSRPYPVSTIDTVNGIHPPILTVSLGARKELALNRMTPGKNARLDKAQPNTFSYSLTDVNKDEKTFAEIKPETATFVWKEASGTEHKISMGAQQSVVVPANTFPSAELQYKFIIRTNSGQDITSAWRPFFSTDTTSTATALSPDGGIIDADNPVKFTWQHNNTSGAPQTQAEIALNRDNEGFKNTLLPKSEDMFYTFPPGTLKSGKYEWKVRTYNLDGVPGAWSAPKQFLALAAPTAPVIVALTDAPRPVLKWQSDGQSAYRIKLDDNHLITYYGTATTWTSPDYLSPGKHTVDIQIQDEYGFWSPWAEAGAIVPDATGARFPLAVDCRNITRLTWDAIADKFIIYRNNVPIGITTEQTYEDDYSVGAAQYYVRGIFAGAAQRYILSEVYNAYCVPGEVVFQPGPGEEWLPVSLTDDQYRTITTNSGQQQSSMYLSGRDYPVQLMSPFKSKAIDLSFAGTDLVFISQIKNAVGKLCCIKTPGGSLIRGHLSQLSVREGIFYTVFNLHLEQEYINERVNLDD